MQCTVTYPWRGVIEFRGFPWGGGDEHFVGGGGDALHGIARFWIA